MMLCFGMPNGVVESEPSNAGRSSGVLGVVPVRDQRVDDVGPPVPRRRPRPASWRLPPGLVQIGSVSASQEKPPP